MEKKQQPTSDQPKRRKLTEDQDFFCKASSTEKGSTAMARAEVLDSSDYFMAVAVLSAQRSNDPSTQVGACIVKKNKVVGTGYNGMPNGCGDDQLPWARAGAADKRLNTKYPFVCHAELNAIINSNSADVRDCTIYVTLLPCNECAKLIIQAGIKEVVYLSDKYEDQDDVKASRRLLEAADIPSTEFKPDMTNIDIDFKSTNQPAKCSKK